jgi:hypothetical protein
MMVEQDVLDLLALEAPPEPEKVQVVARFSKSGAAVGSGTGDPRTWVMAAMPRTKASLSMVTNKLWLEEQ